MDAGEKHGEKGHEGLEAETRVVHLLAEEHHGLLTPTQG